jgi:hypothetical protein
MGNFKDQAEMLTFAKEFINERIRALEKDVEHCMTEPFAPLPAIGYCFSTINLLGELSVRKRPRRILDSDYQTQTYMQTFMGYNAEQTELLMQIFRHKVAHLAIPNPLYVDSQGRRIVWVYFHIDASVHLQLSKAAPGSVMTPSQAIPGWKIPYDYGFILSIGRFVTDIKNSVDDGNGNGYLVKLQTDATLQSTFEDAICEIYRS